MSKDNVLKKQFQEKDVQRLRNLVQGKHADKSQVSVGFSKGQELIISKEILGPKEIRRGQLKTALNKMLPNWMPLKQQLISLFSALLVRK